MPIYEFKCQKCGSEFEFLCIRNDDRAKCPGCGAEDTERLLSTFCSLSSGSANIGASSCNSSGGFS